MSIETEVGSGRLDTAIRKAIEQCIADMVKEEIEKAKKSIDERIPEITARVGVQIASTFDQLGNESILQIRVRPNR